MNKLQSDGTASSSIREPGLLGLRQDNGLRRGVPVRAGVLLRPEYQGTM